MKQKRHTTEEIIRILREADSGKDLEAERPHGGLGYRTPTQAFNEAQTLDTKVANTMPTT